LGRASAKTFLADFQHCGSNLGYTHSGFVARKKMPLILRTPEIVFTPAQWCRCEWAFCPTRTWRGRRGPPPATLPSTLSPFRHPEMLRTACQVSVPTCRSCRKRRVRTEDARTPCASPRPRGRGRHRAVPGFAWFALLDDP